VARPPIVKGITKLVRGHGDGTRKGRKGLGDGLASTCYALERGTEKDGNQQSRLRKRIAGGPETRSGKKNSWVAACSKKPAGREGATKD